MTDTNVLYTKEVSTTQLQVQDEQPLFNQNTTYPKILMSLESCTGDDGDTEPAQTTIPTEVLDNEDNRLEVAAILFKGKFSIYGPYYERFLEMPQKVCGGDIFHVMAYAFFSEMPQNRTTYSISVLFMF